MKNLKKELAIFSTAILLSLGLGNSAVAMQGIKSFDLKPAEKVTEQSIEQEIQTVSGTVYTFEGEKVENRGVILTNVDITTEEGTKVRGYTPKDYKEENSFYKFFNALNEYSEKHNSLSEVVIKGYKLTEENFKESNCYKYNKDENALIMKILELDDKTFKFD